MQRFRLTFRNGEQVKVVVGHFAREYLANRGEFEVVHEFALWQLYDLPAGWRCVSVEKAVELRADNMLQTAPEYVRVVYPILRAAMAVRLFEGDWASSSVRQWP